MKKNNLLLVGIALALAFVLAGAGHSPALAEESQSVTLTTSDDPVAGETFQVHVNYATSDGGSSAGIGLTLYFNSEDVTYTGAADFRDTDETIIPEPADVRDDEALDGGGDGDETTDSYMEMKWVDANEAFGPGVIATLEFTLIRLPTWINVEPDPTATDTDYSIFAGIPLDLIEQPVFHTIIASATPTEAGSIFPSGNAAVFNEADETFEVSVNDGYAIDAVTVDGAAAELAEDNTYTFTAVTGDHSISVSFRSTISGDINGDGAIDLADVIAALKTLAGIQGAANADTDVNGDDAIGLSEAIYVLQWVAGL